MRIGQGYDAHRFEAGSRLVLGGVEIPYGQGLQAHSDGDVVIHALCDALLGAVGLGDIGRHFPDTDQTYAGIDSRILLRNVMDHLQERRFQVVNADLTLVAQYPKLSPYMDAMQHCLSQDLRVDARRINIKATTTEGMGFTGRGEGIAVLAVVLLDEVAFEQTSLAIS
jgi:2-C-methyl-D-erythritol 2,4-cyclodiphosphate synthase